MHEKGNQKKERKENTHRLVNHWKSFQNCSGAAQINKRRDKERDKKREKRHRRKEKKGGKHKEI